MAIEPKLFLSHTTRDARDQSLAQKLAAGLKIQGVIVWAAPDSIHAGDQWEPAIVDAIEQCTHALVIVSEASVRSPWVLREIGLIRRRVESGAAMKVIPLRVGEVGSFENSEFLSKFQELRFSSVFATQLHDLAAVLRLPPAVPLRFQALIAEKTRHFVGRGHVFADLQKFLTQERKGYFTILGDPGQGKTTIIAEYVRRTGCPVHFNSTPEGVDTVREFHDSIQSQLVTRYDVGEPTPAEQRESFGIRISELLAKAATARPQGEPFILAIDALDEVKAEASSGNANVLSLPQVLPEGVFLLLTRRRRDDIPFRTTERHRILDLMTDGGANRGDVQHYLRLRLAEAAFGPWLERRGWTLDRAVTELAILSEDNFMYLYYVLQDIAAGEFFDPSSEMPTGLVSYYEDHWRKMGMRGRTDIALRIDILGLLVAFGGPVSVPTLAAIAGAPVPDVLAVIDEWREFLHETRVDSERRYRVYHSSFQEFLASSEVLAGRSPDHWRRLIAKHFEGLWS